MSKHDLLESVRRARHKVVALRARLENEGTAPGSPEIGSALGDLLEMLERLQTQHELMCEVLARADTVFAKDPYGRYVMINQKGAGMFGKSVEEILGQDDTALFERGPAERIMAIDRLVMSSGTPCTFEETLDIRGVPTTLLTTETAWYEPRGKLRGLIGTAQDVTERKRAERGVEVHQDRLRSLAWEIVIVEERLRQALSAELHNELGQYIALTKMKLSALRDSSGTELHDPLTQIESLVEHANRSLRSITCQLSPPALHDLGLVPALQWLAEDLGGRYALSMRIEDEGTPAVADDRIRVILFRAVRELLINVATHAAAREAIVRLASEDGLLRITVEDGGAGFDVDEVGLQGHGLFGVREQLRHVGGSMHIVSAPGRGTKVVLSVRLATSGTDST